MACCTSNRVVCAQVHVHVCVCLSVLSFSPTDSSSYSSPSVAHAWLISHYTLPSDNKGPKCLTVPHRAVAAESSKGWNVGVFHSRAGDYQSLPGGLSPDAWVLTNEVSRNPSQGESRHMHWQWELLGHWGSRELMSQHQGKQRQSRNRSYRLSLITHGGASEL